MLIALPDLHGRADLLEAALRYYPEDTNYIFLGDAIDRGPQSRDCVRRLLELSDAGRVILLRGNHENMLSTAAEYDRLAQEMGDANLLKLAREEFVNWQRNGGNALFKEYGLFGPGNVPEDLLEFIRRTRLAFESPSQYLCSHAAPPVLLERYHTVADTMLWARPNEGPFELEKHIKGSIHGHTPLATPTWVEKHLYIDLGAVFSGNLCTVNLESLETIVLQGPSTAGREALLELASDEEGLVRDQPYRIVEI
jgi:serine/threonine protein phosphatase 1